MSFLNGVLAIGALAFTIPLVIHLLFRSRFRTIDWGAMYLLESVVRVNRRRMQLTQLLLLLLRCLIPILLAMCLARPVWQSITSFAGDAPRTLVIAIDDSRSLSLTPPGQPPQLERAKEQIRIALENLTRRDEVILVRGSRLGVVPAKMGMSQALSKVRKLDAVAGRVSAAALLDAGLAACRDATHPRRQILLVSDFQENTVGVSELDAAKRLAEKMERGSTETFVVIDLLDLSPDWEEVSNVSVDEVSLQSPVLVKSRAGVFSARVHNGANTPSADLRLVWSIDGKPLEPRRLTIPPKSSRTNRLTHSFDRAGMHEVTVSVGRSDQLSDDNQRSLAVEVISQVDVLLVDGRPSRTPLQGQADFLALALSPFAFGGDDRPDPVRAQVVSERRLPESLETTNARVIVLAGVGKLSEASRQELSDWVQRGGALVVFDGPGVTPELFNEDWAGASEDSEALRFPAVLRGVVGEADETDGIAAEIDLPSPQYAPWKILSPGDTNPFEDTSLRVYRKLELRDEDNSIALLKTTAGDPLCVLRPQGEGKVIQFALSASTDWSNLPLRPVFLPMIQQMVLELAGKRDQVTLPVGTPLVISPDEWTEPNVASDEITSATDVRKKRRSKTPLSQPSFKTTYSLRSPTGERELPAPPAGEPLRVTTTYEPGVYEVRRRRVDLNGTVPEQVESEMRVAEVDASESIMQGVTDETLDAFAAAIQGEVFTNASDLRSADRLRSFGYELWRPLLILLLVALVLELWLQQYLASSNTGTRASSGQTASTGAAL
ncbi:MAG: BatA domain-containing protein [Planctomycetota bacterium]